jgi:hypothetical protein
MPCRDCQHFSSSIETNRQRPGLVGYGYCRAAPTVTLRARFFHDSQSPCWLAESRYVRRRPLPEDSP